MSLSSRALKLKPSATLALAARAGELAKQGKSIISFAVGEPDWDTFEYIKDAAKKALDAGKTKYTPAAGIPELRQALAETVKRDLGLEYAANQVSVGVGAKQIIFNILQVLCNPGDEVIIPAPYWVSYPSMVELADAKPVIASCGVESNFKLTPDILKHFMTAKTKVLILNSPSNPTGEVYTREELQGLAQVLERTGVYVISDDIYDKMVFDIDSTPHIAQVSESLRPRVLLVNSVSKTYSMTGWRLGSVIGDKKIIDAISNYQSQSTSCAPSFAQWAAITALTSSQEPVKKAMQELRRRRDYLYDTLTRMPLVKLKKPQGAFYAWLNIEGVFGKQSDLGVVSGSQDFSNQILEKEGLALVPGIEFGLEGYVRISYTVSREKLEEGLKRLGRFMETLK